MNIDTLLSQEPGCRLWHSWIHVECEYQYSYYHLMNIDVIVNVDIMALFVSGAPCVIRAKSRICRWLNVMWTFTRRYSSSREIPRSSRRSWPITAFCPVKICTSCFDSPRCLVCVLISSYDLDLWPMTFKFSGVLEVVEVPYLTLPYLTLPSGWTGCYTCAALRPYQFGPMRSPDVTRRSQWSAVKPKHRLWSWTNHQPPGTGDV